MSRQSYHRWKMLYRPGKSIKTVSEESRAIAPGIREIEPEKMRKLKNQYQEAQNAYLCNLSLRDGGRSPAQRPLQRPTGHKGTVHKQ